MKIVECEQGSPEWKAARCGVISASNFDKIITTKGERSKSAEKYLWQLAGEIVSGTQEETFKSAAMQRGNDLEQEARETYEFITGNEVKQVGFCVLDDVRAGASPDGLVGDDGLTEFKCPSAAVHVSYLLDGGLPLDYFQQVQGQLAVTGRKWVDFFSYYPGIKPHLHRVERNEEFIAKLLNLLTICDKELKAIVEKIRS